MDEPTPNPTPSFTSAPISSDNAPGDYSLFKWLFLALIIVIIFLFFVSK